MSRPVYNVEGSGRHRVVVFVLVLFIVALGLRLAVLGSLLSHGVDPRSLDGDSPLYDTLGYNLATQGVYSGDSQPPYTPHGFRAPGYPLFLAGVYRVWGHDPHVAVAAHVLLAALGIAAVFLLAKAVLGLRIAVVGAAFWAVDPFSILWANKVMSDTICGLLVTTGILLLVAAWRRSETGLAALSGLALGLAALVRPETAYLVPLLAAVLVLTSRRRLRWAKAGVLVAGFALVVSPWVIRNYVVFGRAELTSGGGWFACVDQAAWPYAVDNELDYSQVRREWSAALQAGGVNDFEVADRGWLVARRVWPQHIPTWIRLCAVGAVKTLMAPARETPQQVLQGAPPQIVAAVTAWAHVFWWGVLCLAAVGAVYALPRLEPRWFPAPLLVAVVYFVLFPRPMGQPRYRLPVIPIICLLAAFGAVYLWGVWREKRSARRSITSEGAVKGGGAA